MALAALDWLVRAPGPAGWDYGYDLAQNLENDLLGSRLWFWSINLLFRMLLMLLLGRRPIGEQNFKVFCFLKMLILLLLGWSFP